MVVDSDDGEFYLVVRGFLYVADTCQALLPDAGPLHIVYCRVAHLVPISAVEDECRIFYDETSFERHRQSFPYQRTFLCTHLLHDGAVTQLRPGRKQELANRQFLATSAAMPADFEAGFSARDLADHASLSITRRVFERIRLVRARCRLCSRVAVVICAACCTLRLCLKLDAPTYRQPCTVGVALCVLSHPVAALRRHMRLCSAPRCCSHPGAALPMWSAARNHSYVCRTATRLAR